MSIEPFDPGANEPDALSAEWMDVARLAARNLGMGETLHDLSPEHWQLVLVNVEAKMRMRGFEPPDGWQDALARRAVRALPER